MKKKYSFFLSIFLITTVQFSYSPSAMKSPARITKILKSNNQITPYKDIIEWRYKIINGKMYKRKFNYTTLEWVGKWILVV